ncbi:MAG: hypothetical protein WAW17_33970 [Rhodococcus sp. (in: high G+C Gram-positive bacteria)]|uniref:hypothetical protein n=1 Tax=Rhodococcus sp. TaxID=1831 RepID=UPI003BB13E2E
MTLLSLPACPDIAGAVVWGDARCVPEGITRPFAPWLLDYALPVVAAVAVLLMIRSAVRQKKLTWMLMISTASASTWWLEAFGDWGQHLSYSPVFNHYVLTWTYTAPHNPLWMPLMYAVYWVAHAWAILKLAEWSRRKFGWSLGKGIVLLSIPLTFVWNLIIEGFAAWAGWWTYEPGIGPVLDMGRGNWPLLWPMLLMFGWINLISWVVGPPHEATRFNRLERLFRLDTLLQRTGWHTLARVMPSTAVEGPESRVALADRLEVLDPAAGSARFQLVRMCCWVVFFNVTFVLTLDVPLVAVRLISGWTTPYF